VRFESCRKKVIFIFVLLCQEVRCVEKDKINKDVVY
jgi:hypothetical protein